MKKKHLVGQSLHLSSYQILPKRIEYDPIFSRSNVLCWCKSTRSPCTRTILLKFQHPEPTIPGSYRYAVLSLQSQHSSATESHMAENVRTKLRGKSHAIKILSLGYWGDFFFRTSGSVAVRVGNINSLDQRDEAS